MRRQGLVKYKTGRCLLCCSGVHQLSLLALEGCRNEVNQVGVRLAEKAEEPSPETEEWKWRKRAEKRKLVFLRRIRGLSC